MPLTAISEAILDETSPPRRLREAMDNYVLLCSDIGGVEPGPAFDGWAEDSFLDHGVAINPRAAAHCARDYRRSVIFIRAVYAAIRVARRRFSNAPIQILYAGCGPFATLLLPVLGKFKPAELEVQLLDIHPRSLDSVRRLVAHCGYSAYRIDTVQADACSYQHPGTPHLVIAETMQKSLEQEPQVAVTANLAPQLCPRGIFIPEKIEVELCLAHLDREEALVKHGYAIDPDALAEAGERYPLATVLTLLPHQAGARWRETGRRQGTSKPEPDPVRIRIPRLRNLESFDALLFTRIQAFARYRLGDYDSEITLPQRCHEISPLRGGAFCRVGYRLGSYPKFELAWIDDD